MRTAEELERIAFRESLTGEEDHCLVGLFTERASRPSGAREKTPLLKQAAFFATRAFDKGARDPAALERYRAVLAEVQRIAPSDSFRRKLAEVKSALSGKDSHGAILKKLARQGSAGTRSNLADDAALDEIQARLQVALPPSYRSYLKQYAHRLIGTYEPYTAAQLADAAREAWDGGLEPCLLPFLEDNSDLFCFDLRSTLAEPPVVFRPHDGTSTETWANFPAWVEECWLAELDED